MKTKLNSKLMSIFAALVAAVSFVLPSAADVVAKTADGRTFESLSAALAAVTKDNALTEVSEDVWKAEKQTYYNGIFYGTLGEAIAAADAADAAEPALIYVRPKQKDVTIADAHKKFTTSITIFGNNASLKSGYEVAALEYAGNDANIDYTLTKDVSHAIYNLHDGACFWGSRQSEHTIDLVMENCTNAHEILNYPSSKGGVTNVRLVNCTIEYGNGKCGAQDMFTTKNPGTVLIEGCTFVNSKLAINACLEQGAADSVLDLTIKNCTFSKCRGEGEAKGVIRTFGTVGSVKVSVENCTFEDCSTTYPNISFGKNSAAENLAAVDYTVKNTAASINAFAQGTADKSSITTKSDETLKDSTAPSVAAVCKIGETTYETLAAAIAAVPTDNTPTTIKVIADHDVAFSGSCAVSIGGGKNVILDLSGKTIRCTATGGSNAFIDNSATLTITDSVGKVEGQWAGKMIYEANAVWHYSETDPKGYASNLIRNTGNLTVCGGHLENSNPSGSAVFVIDCLPTFWGSDSVVTIVDGELVSNSTALRAYESNEKSNNGAVVVNIQGGLIRGGGYAMWVHNGNSIPDKSVKLSISGGIFDASDYSLYCWGGANWDKFEVDITGGEFLGDVGFASATAGVKASITGGNFRGAYGAFSFAEGQYFISGGFYYGEYALDSEYHVIPGKMFIGDTDHYYVGDATARLIYYWDDEDDDYDGWYSRNYQTLAEAVDGANEGDWVQLVRDCTENVETESVAAFVFDPDGHSFTGKISGSYGYSLVENDDGTFTWGKSLSVCQIGETTYPTLQEAVAAAQPGDVIEVISDVSDQSVTVDKSVSITSELAERPVLTNVKITATGKDVDLTVAALAFAGDSYVNANTCRALTVSNVMADVTLTYDPTPVVNSRRAFIALGRDETPAFNVETPLLLTVVDSDFTVRGDGYPDVILGWRWIADGSSLKRNVMGKANAGNWDVVKFLNIADEALVTLEGNDFYGTGNGIAFSQNNSRDNSYGVILKDNNFYGDGVDWVWVEYTGAPQSGKINARVNAVGGNTVTEGANPRRDFLASDIRSANQSMAYYGGVAVQTNAEGRIVGGTMSKISNAALVAEGFQQIVGADGTWTVCAMIRKEDGETFVPAFEQQSGSSVDEQKVDQVVTDEAAKTAIKQDTVVEGVKLTTTPKKSGDTVIAPAGMQAVVDAAKAKNAELAVALEAETASMVTVKVEVAVSPVKYENATEASQSVAAFKLDPKATVTVVNTTGTGTEAVTTSKSETVKVTNDMIDQTAGIAATIFTGFQPEMIVHKDENGKVIETFTADQIVWNADKKTATVTITHFSTLEAVKVSYAAQAGDGLYGTLAEAFAAVPDATPTTVKVLKDLTLTDGVTFAASKTATLDFAGRTITGGSITSAGALTLTGGTMNSALACDGGTMAITGGDYGVALPETTSTATNAGPFLVSGGTFVSAIPWAYCALGYEPQAKTGGKYGVKDANIFIRNIAAAQRYPWNGYVDITLDVCWSDKATARLFVLAYDGDDNRMDMTDASVIVDGVTTAVDCSRGFEVTASEKKTIHVMWNSAEAVSEGQVKDGVHFKFIAK